MASVKLGPVYDDFIEYLLGTMSPQQILDFEASPESIERSRELVERNNAGTLTASEALELEQMLEADRLVSVLKSRALKEARRRDANQ